MLAVDTLVVSKNTGRIGSSVRGPELEWQTGLGKWEWRDLNPQPMDYEFIHLPATFTPKSLSLNGLRRIVAAFNELRLHVVYTISV